MPADPNSKSPRTFQCRDLLWETFEKMAKDLECSVDYLLNESMRQYARSKNYGARLAPSQAPLSQNPERKAVAAQGGHATKNTAAPRIPPPPPRGASHAPPPPRASMPPPMPGAPSRTLKGVPGAAPTRPAILSILYNGEKFPVTKERFVLGRGRQTSDFTLKDPNVSRQHALIELQNGTYFMVDMGSTNGVEFKGQRVARKPIAEGDVYTICDHELVCTFR